MVMVGKKPYADAAIRRQGRFVAEQFPPVPVGYLRTPKRIVNRDRHVFSAARTVCSLC
jgi:hypothetical protein